jgi:hypothetical protein
LEQSNIERILYSYLIIKTEFKFPKSVKYPSIPCFVDKDTTGYPLEGEAVLTGSEYVVARKMGCIFNIKSIFYLPYKKVRKDNVDYNSFDPFK